MTSPDQFIVLSSRAKFTRLTLTSLVGVVVAIWMMLNLSEHDRGFGPLALTSSVIGMQAALIIFRLFAGFAALFFGVCGVLLARRATHKHALVVVDEEGIVDNASAVGVGFIHRHEIQAIRDYRFMNQRFLGIVPLDFDPILERLPPGRRRFVKANAATGFAPINIPQASLPIPLDDVIAEMVKRGYRVETR